MSIWFNCYNNVCIVGWNYEGQSRDGGNDYQVSFL